MTLLWCGMGGLILFLCRRIVPIATWFNKDQSTISHIFFSQYFFYYKLRKIIGNINKNKGGKKLEELIIEIANVKNICKVHLSLPVDAGLYAIVVQIITFNSFQCGFITFIKLPLPTLYLQLIY